MNIAEAKQQDLVAYLEKLGHRPAKVLGTDYWYLSPLRDEKTASFKIDSKQNVFYDHGSGVGGNIIDFARFYYNCTVKEVLQKLKDGGSLIQRTPSLHQPKPEGKIKIISESEITDPTLRNYLHGRKIPLIIANQYCHQVAFELKDIKHLAIGFKNGSGGYELRNYYFKGSSTPKEPKLILQKDSKDLVVIEGFFSMLSFKVLQEKLGIDKTSILVLNSIAFFEKSRSLMEQHSTIHLFLDNDATGKANVLKALDWSSRYKDQSHHYRNRKDLNDHLIKSLEPELKQNWGIRLNR